MGDSLDHGSLSVHASFKSTEEWYLSWRNSWAVAVRWCSWESNHRWILLHIHSHLDSFLPENQWILLQLEHILWKT